MEALDSVVYVIDDSSAVRESLESLIASVGLPVRTFVSASDFLDAHEPGGPGCIVLDVLRMPGMSGLALQSELAARSITLPVIFMTAYGDVPTAVSAMKAGAFDFIEKPFGDQQFLEILQAAVATSAVSARQRAEHSECRKRLNLLTKREREVLEAIAAGKPNKIIAHELSLSRKTVEFHRANVMRKLGVKHVADLIKVFMCASATEARSGPPWDHSQLSAGDE